MLNGNARLFAGIALFSAFAASRGRAQTFDLSWHTVDGGGAMSATGGSFELSGTIGQADAGGPLTGGAFSLTGGFWPGAATAGTGVPAATITAAVSRKSNPTSPLGCITALIPGVASEPHQGGISDVRITFDLTPGGPGPNPVSIEQATCAAPSYVPYSGAATVSAGIGGNTLLLTFTPGLENARTYKITVNSSVSSIPGQFVEVAGLVGDVNSDGQVNATDRSVVVGAWTGSGFSCPSDANNDGQTNATDRSLVVGAWTGPQNCAP